MRKSLIIAAIIASVTILCQCSRKSDDLVKAVVYDSAVQLDNLVKESAKDSSLQIPGYYDGEVRFVPWYDWISGFFAGNLWYMYDLTGNEKWADAAERQTELLDTVKTLTWHHDVGFMINCSYGNGLRLKGTEAYKEVMVTAARSLCTRFKPKAGIIQSWNVTGGKRTAKGWVCPVIIDNMMNLELLFKAAEISGDSTIFNIAVSHADKTIENHFRPDGSSYHVIDYDPETGAVRGKCTSQGYSDESAWARGQAWGLYGFTMAYRFTGFQRYLDKAEEIEKFIFGNRNMPEDLVPYWDFDSPDIPNTYRDVSSAAIIASALYEMYSVTSQKNYLKTADKVMLSLSGPAYRAQVGANGGFLLMHSVGSLPDGGQVDVAINYADYYFLEALARKRAIQVNQN